LDFFFSSRRRHTRLVSDWSSDVCSSDLGRENLVLQGEFYGLTGRKLRVRIAESLQRFGLSDAADRQVKTYSGGMQRRLDVALGRSEERRVGEGGRCRRGT